MPKSFVDFSPKLEVGGTAVFFKFKWPGSLLKVKVHLINDQKLFFLFFLQFSSIAGQETIKE